MKYTEARQGRIFIIRLEHGEIVHETIEKFAEAQGIKAAALIAVGGADDGSTLVVGPEDEHSLPVDIKTLALNGVHEIAGTGTLFPDDDGDLILHMHMACGKSDATVTGCIRAGVSVWHVMEIILFELLDCTSRRILDEALGFKLLVP